MSTESEKPKIKLKHSSKIYVKKSNLKNEIIKEIKSVEAFDKNLKFDLEIIKAVLQEIEKRFKKMDDHEKSEYALSILSQLFNLSNDEKSIVQKSIIYIQENKMIKKNSKLYSIGATIIKFAKKRLGF